MAAITEKTRHAGIYINHKRDCQRAADVTARCDCKPTFKATVYSRRDRKSIARHFARLAEAKTWREDTAGAIRAGQVVKPSGTTVTAALDDYIAGMESGAILDRSGKTYKPATCRSYKRAAEHLKAELGRWKLADLRRADVQGFIDQLRVDGLSASTIRNRIDPLRCVYRRAVRRDDVTLDPTHGLELPAVRSNRDRTASPAESEQLIDALPESERALWALALYIGLRRGELQELRWSDLDLDAGIGRVERAYDDEGRCLIDTKTEAGERMFPLVAPVRRRLVAHKLATGRGGDDLVFGRTARDRFVPSTVRRHARDAWKVAKLKPITLHESRHSAATSSATAGLDFAALKHVLGHSSITTTIDTYGHVRPDRIDEARDQLDAYYAAVGTKS